MGSLFNKFSQTYCIHQAYDQKLEDKKNKPKESFLLMLNVEILYKSQNTILELIQKDHFIVEHHNLKVQTPL